MLHMGTPIARMGMGHGNIKTLQEPKEISDIFNNSRVRIEIERALKPGAGQIVDLGAPMGRINDLHPVEQSRLQRIRRIRKDINRQVRQQRLHRPCRGISRHSIGLASGNIKNSTGWLHQFCELIVSAI